MVRAPMPFHPLLVFSSHTLIYSLMNFMLHLGHVLIHFICMLLHFNLGTYSYKKVGKVSLIISEVSVENYSTQSSSAKLREASGSMIKLCLFNTVLNPLSALLAYHYFISSVSPHLIYFQALHASYISQAPLVHHSQDKVVTPGWMTSSFCFNSCQTRC